jgi:hypothetical protein
VSYNFLPSRYKKFVTFPWHDKLCRLWHCAFPLGLKRPPLCRGLAILVSGSLDNASNLLLPGNGAGRSRDFTFLSFISFSPMAVGQFLRCGEPLNTTANYWESQVSGVWSNLKDVRYTREQAASNKNCRLYYDLWGVCSHLLWCVYFIYTCICICLNTHAHTHIYIYTYTSYTHIYIYTHIPRYISIYLLEIMYSIYIYCIKLYYVMLSTHMITYVYNMYTSYQSFAGIPLAQVCDLCVWSSAVINPQTWPLDGFKGTS